MAQTEPEERHLPLDDRLADRPALGFEPRVGVFLPHVHRAAHDPERIVVAQIRNRLAFVEFDRVPFDAVLTQEVPEHSRVLERDVLKDQDSWLGGGHGIPPAVMTGAQRWYRVRPEAETVGRGGMRGTPIMTVWP